MIYLWIALGLYSLFYGTWIFYVAFMNIKEHQDFLKLKLGLLWNGLRPVFIVALLMDVLFNFIIGTLYYREFPKELLFTSRCHRHLKGTGIQLARAQQVCAILLDPFDSGHCL